MKAITAGNICGNDFLQTGTDQYIGYPGDKSFGKFIDVGRLRSIPASAKKSIVIFKHTSRSIFKSLTARRGFDTERYR